MLEQIFSDYHKSIKNHDPISKITLNLLISQIKNKQIELQRALTDEEIISIIKKEIKILTESLEFLRKANKTEQIQEAIAQKSYLEHYLPPMLDTTQTKALIINLISELQITDLKKERGTLIKELIARHKTELDTTLVNFIINTML